MGDWNTLHIFNDRDFYDRLVPDFKDRGAMFKHHMDSLLGKYILGNNDNSETRTLHLVDLCRQLKPDFKIHGAYYKIESRQKKPTEDYKDFISKRVEDGHDFLRVNASVIEDLNLLLTLVIFAECGAFNPHLILGRRTFSSNIKARPGSLAENIIQQTWYHPLGSIYTTGSGPMNWISYDELNLLWLDKHNLHVPPEGSEQYLQEFLEFTELALQHKCGFISVTNVNETMLCRIENPGLKIDVDPRAKGWESVITYTSKY